MGLEMPSPSLAKEEQDQEEGVEVHESIEEEDREEDSEQHDQRRQKTTGDDGAVDLAALRSRPSILLVGPPAVGKRTLVNRLIARGRRSGPATSESGAICYGWTLDTKYYTANVCMWTARLDNSSLENAASIKSGFGRCEALVLVFDLSSSHSFEQLQEWVAGLELGSFEILLCVGNKADRVPEHFGHAEYRRKLQKSGESSADPHPEFWDFGIERTEGSSLLEGEEQAVEERRRLAIEWCSDMGIEYIESCAINEVFDDCLCVDGDVQGVPRIHGALSAHMWPGLTMKDGSESNDATPSNEMTSDDDSDYYVEYELLSNGSAAEQWEASEWEDQWSFSAPVAASDGPTPPESTDSHPTSMDTDLLVTVPSDPENQSNVSTDSASPRLIPDNNVDLHGAQHLETQQAPNGQLGHEERSTETIGDSGRQSNSREIDDMEQLMREMSHMRTNMRSMSDQNRRERAAQLALRMASMFKDDEGGESDME